MTWRKRAARPDDREDIAGARAEAEARANRVEAKLDYMLERQNGGG